MGDEEMSTHLTYDDLTALIVGDLPEDQKEILLNHLKSCRQCQTLVNKGAKLRDHVAALQESLLTEHPEPSTLIRYFHGELEEEEAEWIEQHLMNCETCWLSEEVVEDALRSSSDPNHVSSKSEATALWEWMQQKQGVSNPQKKIIFDLWNTLSAVGDQLKSFWKSKEYFYATPISIKGLVPALTATEYAASDEGFAEEKTASEDSPFALTVYKFGKEYRIHVKTADPFFMECLLLIRFSEGYNERYNGLVLLHHGEGEIRMEEAERLLLVPIQKLLEPSVEILWPLADLREDQKPKVAEALTGLLEHPSPDIRVYLLQILADLGTQTILAAVSSLENDPDNQVQSAAKTARAKIEQRPV